ncbi:MAG TPA: amidase [Ktedonobacteraceae bacterium]|nr:amidase [Ktedonobacteraceae bacterium]
MLIHASPLAETAAMLRSGQLDLFAYIDEICSWIDVAEPEIHALLPEKDRRQRLMREAIAIQERFPDSYQRPPLYGIPVGVKDVFRVDGFPTQAGSRLPAELFAGAEATCIRTLRNAGAIILGKTVSTEFAWIEPGPTRNPHHLGHTPGGSSSGSAAAVAAGYCPLAIGTQTIGSTIRPAAFCGIVGFKPSYGRIPTAGLILFSESVDTIGLFTQDVDGMAVAASLLCNNWDAMEFTGSDTLPVIGVPDGPYLAQASPEGLSAFNTQLSLLEQAGCTVRHVTMLEDIEIMNEQHRRLAFGELALVHADWFAQYESLYRPRTVEAIRKGQCVSSEELIEYRAGRVALRTALEQVAQIAGIDLWVCPAAPGAAPEGIITTGDSIMNLPWTYAGLPAITLPAGNTAHGLPLGLQCIGKYMGDEQLIQWAEQITILC